MAVEAGNRLTRAQAEGISYKLPEDEQSRIFEKQFHSLKHEPAILLEVLHLAQQSFGYLSQPVLGWLSQQLHIPRSQVLASKYVC